MFNKQNLPKIKIYNLKILISLIATKLAGESIFILLLFEKNCHPSLFSGHKIEKNVFVAFQNYCCSIFSSFFVSISTKKHSFVNLKRATHVGVCRVLYTHTKLRFFTLVLISTSEKKSNKYNLFLKGHGTTSTTGYTSIQKLN